MPLKVWNGSSWVSSTGVKVWNGSSWVQASSGKVWNGSSWVNFLSIFTCQLTEGDYVDGSYRKQGYSRDFETFFPAIGSVNNNTISDSSQFVAFEYRIVPFKSSTINTFSFIVTGDQRSSGWSSINYNGNNYDLINPNVVTYDSDSNTTSWLLPGVSPFTSAGTVRTFTIN